MRQVPASNMHSRPTFGASYLVIGDGRLARHMAHYLSLEKIEFSQWSRSGSVAGSVVSSELNPQDHLRALAERATHVLVAISDRAIEPFLRAHSFLLERECVHFSGSLVTELAVGAHPLMTFGAELYPLEMYRSIPFVVDGRTLPEILPGLDNSSHVLLPSQKPLYHALCSMSGNFTVMLWEKVFADFEARLGLPRDLLYPFLAQTAANLIKAAPGDSVLTGPLVRGDMTTIEKHLSALGQDPYAAVYRSFVSAYHSKVEAVPFPLGGFS